jgi:hypothetical protein
MRVPAAAGGKVDTDCVTTPAAAVGDGGGVVHMVGVAGSSSSRAPGAEVPLGVVCEAVYASGTQQQLLRVAAAAAAAAAVLFFAVDTAVLLLLASMGTIAADASHQALQEGLPASTA